LLKGNKQFLVEREGFAPFDWFNFFSDANRGDTYSKIVEEARIAGRVDLTFQLRFASLA
jgi:hypothetical protein